MSRNTALAILGLAGLILATPAEADGPLSIWGVVGSLPTGVTHGVVCNGGPTLAVSIESSCFTPVGIGEVLSTWSKDHFMYALVRDLDGDELCFAGPVEGLSRGMNVVPLPGKPGLEFTLACMAKFNRLRPVPKGVFLVYY